MKRFWLLGLALSIVAVGCGSKGVTVTGENGEKVSVDPASGDMTVTDKDGKTMTVESDGKTVTAKGRDGTELKIEEGKFSGTNEKGEKFEGGVAKVSESELGLPFYPGSTEMEFGSSKLDGPDGTTLSMNRTSNDMPEKVIEFYKAKFKEPQMFNSSANGVAQAQVSGKLEDGADAAVIAIREKDKDTTQVMITVQRKKAK